METTDKAAAIGAEIIIRERRRNSLETDVDAPEPLKRGSGAIYRRAEITHQDDAIEALRANLASVPATTLAGAFAQAQELLRAIDERFELGQARYYREQTERRIRRLAYSIRNALENSLPAPTVDALATDDAHLDPFLPCEDALARIGEAA